MVKGQVNFLLATDPLAGFGKDSAAAIAVGINKRQSSL
tara:strand:+ start:460 stop:573 length:114 start_codon:yes stop_codon:yes gene_type:complete